MCWGHGSPDAVWDEVKRHPDDPRGGRERIDMMAAPVIAAPAAAEPARLPIAHWYTQPPPRRCLCDNTSVHGGRGVVPRAPGTHYRVQELCGREERHRSRRVESRTVVRFKGFRV